MSGARPRFQRGLIDDYQARAREAAGYAQPRETHHSFSEVGVGSIIAVVCEKCGCTFGKAEGKWKDPCPFCGAKSNPWEVHPLTHRELPI